MDEWQAEDAIAASLGVVVGDHGEVVGHRQVLLAAVSIWPTVIVLSALNMVVGRSGPSSKGPRGTPAANGSSLVLLELREANMASVDVRDLLADDVFEVDLAVGTREPAGSTPGNDWVFAVSADLGAVEVQLGLEDVGCGKGAVGAALEPPSKSSVPVSRYFRYFPCGVVLAVSMCVYQQPWRLPRITSGG